MDTVVVYYYSGSVLLCSDFFYEVASIETKHDTQWMEENIKRIEDFGSSVPKNFKFPDYGYHAWVYYEGKHYDSDVPDGVTNLFDLPTFKQFSN
jgi:hypothetical protein